MIIEKNKLNCAANNLKKGNLIIYPTDTLYGLGADATNTSAIKKINQLKKRKLPLSIMIDDIKNIHKYSECDKNIIIKLNEILPGPFTILLKAKKSNLSHLVQNGSDKIGIRIPNHNFCLNLLTKYKKPIITTSVNIHGYESLNTIEGIQKIFPEIDIYEEKIKKKSKGSTIIDFTLNSPKIVRKGDGDFFE